MKLVLKLFIAILVILAIGFFIVRYATKAHSPGETLTYKKEGFDIEVFYNRPYKKGREIFGELVPFEVVWRTGANEATTFETKQDIYIDGSLLKAGKYTLWTIPKKESWKIIFNSKMYPWGIDMDKKAYRDSQFDALVLELPVKKIHPYLEQFTIFFEKEHEFVFLNLAWDETLVSVPIKK